jgi:hypothetical protein
MLVVIVSPWSLGARDRRRQSANDTRIGRARHHNVTLLRTSPEQLADPFISGAFSTRAESASIRQSSHSSSKSVMNFRRPDRFHRSIGRPSALIFEERLRRPALPEPHASMPSIRERDMSNIPELKDVEEFVGDG